jgi:hypothetical protein
MLKTTLALIAIAASSVPAMAFDMNAFFNSTVPNVAKIAPADAAALNPQPIPPGDYSAFFQGFNTQQMTAQGFAMPGFDAKALNPQPLPPRWLTMKPGDLVATQVNPQVVSPVAPSGIVPVVPNVAPTAKSFPMQTFVMK